jgi:hypothetical protein
MGLKQPCMTAALVKVAAQRESRWIVVRKRRAWYRGHGCALTRDEDISPCAPIMHRQHAIATLLAGWMASVAAVSSI